MGYHNMQVDESRLIFAKSAQEAVDGAHALVVLTEWDEFKRYDYREFYATMMKPASYSMGAVFSITLSSKTSALRCTPSAKDDDLTEGCVPSTVLQPSMQLELRMCDIDDALGREVAQWHPCRRHKDRLQTIIPFVVG